MILSDKYIEQQAALNKIITKGFDSNNLKGASYELTASESYFDLTENPSKKLTAKNEDGKKILIKPLHKVVLITQEHLEIPSNILGRIVTKGSLFSIGLSAVNTIADPGFKGQLGLVLYNYSSKYIVLDIGEKVAKIDFSQLMEDSRSYSGQHGFSAQTWPVPTHLQYEYHDVKDHVRMKPSPLEEAYSVLPFEISNLLKVLKAGVTALQIALVILVFVNLATVILLFMDKIDDISAAIFINVISTIVAAVFTFFYKYFISK